jgi:hypothetical protein
MNDIDSYSFLFLLSMTALCGTPGCATEHNAEKTACQTSAHCKNGHTCVAMRCVRTVNCALLRKRIKGCAAQLVENLVPAVRTLPDTRRKRLAQRLSVRLLDAVKNHCPGPPPRPRKGEKAISPGAAAKKWNHCLAQSSCRDFALCVLTRVGIRRHPNGRLGLACL